MSPLNEASLVLLDPSEVRRAGSIFPLARWDRWDQSILAAVFSCQHAYCERCDADLDETTKLSGVNRCGVRSDRRHSPAGR